ncbi:MAG: phosphotransferase [Oligoflexus sp.]
MSRHPRVNQKSRRLGLRKFYQKNKRPKAFFVFGQQLCGGEVVDRSEDGLALLIFDENFSPKEPILQIPRFYLFECQPKYLVENLSVRYVVPVEDNETGQKAWRIGVAAQDANTAARLRSVFEDWFMSSQKNHAESENKVSDGERFDERRIPYHPAEDQYDLQSIERRRKWLEAVSGCRLEHVQTISFSPRILAGNIENFIGCAQVPIGLAGPVHVKGHYVDRPVPLPIATTEGALVSSLTRGAHICNLAGGIKTAIIRQTMLRAPVFRFENLDGALNFVQWVRVNTRQITKIAESNSSVAKLERIDPFVFGQMVHLRFYYETGDAAGQNMTTACTFLACEWIKNELQDDPAIKLLAYHIDGNMSGDKKVNMQNFSMGRGVAVLAECLIPEHLIQKYLRTTSKSLAQSWADSSVVAAQIGMMGANCNFANVIAGIFTATGQDIASVHESSTGILQLKEHEEGLYVSVYLPALVIGTVGGGTGLPTQNECLSMMGCAGKQRVLRFAEIIAAACLSLEISTTGAISAGEFVQAHEKLGRNRQKESLKNSDLNCDFVKSLWTGSEKLIEASVTPLKQTLGVTTTVIQEQKRQAQGLFQANIRLNTLAGKIEDRSMILKIKADSMELVDLGVKLAALSGNDRLPGLIGAFSDVFGYKNSERREVRVYQELQAPLKKFMPEVYGTRLDPERGIQAILLEDLSADLKQHKILHWEEDEMIRAIDALAEMHSVFFNRFEDLPADIGVDRFSSDRLLAAKGLLEELTQFNHERFPELVDTALMKRMSRQLENLPDLLKCFQSFPETLIHYDFNPRNICWKNSQSAQSQLVAYDWELCCFHNPQYDLVELLIYSLPKVASRDLLERLISRYQEQLEKRVGESWNKADFKRVLHANIYLYLLVRGNLHLLVHNLLNFDYIDAVYKNLHRLLSHFEA